MFAGQDVAIPVPEKAQQHNLCAAPLAGVKVCEDRKRLSVVKTVNIYRNSWGLQLPGTS